MGKDPRIFQILTLSAFLAFGLSMRAFDITLATIAIIFGTCLLVQWLGSLLYAVRFDPLSPLITSLSLTLLLRANDPWIFICAGAIAIGSKFLFRINDKHVFNPANIGIVAMVLATPAAWTAPGQWGSAIWLAAIIAGLGVFVTQRAARLDGPLIFLGTFAALAFARALWLGDPLAIPALRLQNGALILFAFFMISDPKTTPDSFAMRAIFMAGAAALAHTFIYNLFINDGLFFALAIMTLIRPVMDGLAKAPAYQWHAPASARAAISAEMPPTPKAAKVFPLSDLQKIRRRTAHDPI